MIPNSTSYIDKNDHWPYCVCDSSQCDDPGDSCDSGDPGEFGNSGESGNSCKFSKCGDFEKKVWNLVLIEKMVNSTILLNLVLMKTLVF